MNAPTKPRRDHILRVAERLLAHYGASKTTIADIAREAGIGVGSVYLEFGSKDEILSALSQERHDVVLAAMRQAAADAPTFAERFESVLLARLDAFYSLASRGHHACDLVVCPASAVQGAHQTYRLAERTFLVELLQRAVRDGDCRLEGTGADAVAELVQRALFTFAPPYVLSEPQARAREYQRTLSRLLLDGLRTRSDHPPVRGAPAPPRARREPPAHR